METGPRILKEWRFECQRCKLEKSRMTKAQAQSVLNGHLKSKEHYESEAREMMARLASSSEDSPPETESPQ